MNLHLLPVSPWDLPSYHGITPVITLVSFKGYILFDIMLTDLVFPLGKDFLLGYLILKMKHN